VTTIRKLSNLGIDTIIRFDPVFMHLFQALYGDSWFDKIAVLIDIFASTGAKHIISSAGKLSRKRSQPVGYKGTSTWQRVYKVIHSESPLAAKKI
jgi:DNA repair photolyase